MYVITAVIAVIVGVVLIAEWIAGTLRKQTHANWLRWPIIEEYARRTQFSRVQCSHCRSSSFRDYGLEALNDQRRIHATSATQSFTGQCVAEVCRDSSPRNWCQWGKQRNRPVTIQKQGMTVQDFLSFIALSIRPTTRKPTTPMTATANTAPTIK